MESEKTGLCQSVPVDRICFAAVPRLKRIFSESIKDWSGRNRVNKVEVIKRILNERDAEKVHSFDDPPKENCVLLVLFNGGGGWQSGCYFKSNNNVYLDGDDHLPATDYFTHWREMPPLP